MPYAWYAIAYGLLWVLTSPQRAVVRPSKKLCSWLPRPSWVIFVRFTRADTFHLVPIALSCRVTLVRALQTFFNAPSRHKVEHVKSYQLAFLSTINCIHSDLAHKGDTLHNSNEQSSSNPDRDSHLVVKVWWQLCSRRGELVILRFGDDKVAGPASPGPH